MVIIHWWSKNTGQMTNKCWGRNSFPSNNNNKKNNIDRLVGCGKVGKICIFQISLNCHQTFWLILIVCVCVVCPQVILNQTRKKKYNSVLNVNLIISMYGTRSHGLPNGLVFDCSPSLPPTPPRRRRQRWRTSTSTSSSSTSTTTLNYPFR